MRGPLLSGPLGSPAALETLMRWTANHAPVVVLGPPWLASAVAGSGPTLALVEREARPQALRARKRAKAEGRPVSLALAAAELPLRRGAVSTLVVENVAGLSPAEAGDWIAALVPCLRPGGRLIAADATSSDAAAARVAGAFLSGALTEIVQEWPRDGAVFTVGVAPAASVVGARYGLAEVGLTPRD
jgi:hypothetical protein